MARLVAAGCVFVLAGLGSVAQGEIIAHWEFGEGSGDSADSSVGGWTATLVNFPDTSEGYGDPAGTPGWTTDGRLSFNGAPPAQAPRVETDFPLSSLNGGSFTIEFAGTHNNGVQNWSPLIGQSSGTVPFFFGKRQGSEQLHFNLPGLGSGDSHVVPVADGNEHHMAVVFDDVADTVWMYFDGNPVARFTGRAGPMTASNNLWLGSVAHQPANEYWNGYADDVRIHDAALSRDALTGASPPQIEALMVVGNHFNSVPNATAGGPREDATAVSTDRVVDKWGNGAGWDTWDQANPDTDFAGLIYPGAILFDKVTVHLGNQFGDGGHWSEAPKLYLLKNLIDTQNADAIASDPASLTRPENSPHWVEVPGAVLHAPGTFGADKTNDVANSPLTFDLSALPLGMRTGYGMAVGGVTGDGSASFISITEMEFSAAYYDRLTPLPQPVSVVANNYNSVPNATPGGAREDALAVSTDGVLFDNGSGGLGWDTWQGHDPGTDFVGLLYGEEVRMDRLVVYLGNQFLDGGAWSEEPNVYLLRNNVDTNTSRPETDPNWEQVAAERISYNVFDVDPDIAGGGALSPYALVVFDLGGLPLSDRTGFGWAIGGVRGDRQPSGNGDFVSIAELRAYMADPLRVPEPGSLLLLALGGAALVGMCLRRRVTAL